MHNSTQVFYTNAHFGTLFFAKIFKKNPLFRGGVLNFPELPLTALLKQQSITSFLFVPCAHNILLDYFASDHTLPKIARGSTDPLTVLKGSHPLKLFQLY